MRSANRNRYGMVLSKDKSEEEAMRWLIRSVHLYPMNWGCWQEMTGLISRVEDVRTYLVCRQGDIRDTNFGTVESNISTPAAKHTVVHLPPPYLPRAISINTNSVELLKSATLHISDKPFPFNMSCYDLLSYERLHIG